jgi:hypothetical protein
MPIMASKWLDWKPTEVLDGSVRGAKVPEVPKVKDEDTSGTFGTCHLTPSTKKAEGSGLPWPGYNNGKQFECDKCGAHFDTSSGIAKHQVWGCGNDRGYQVVKVWELPRCAVCGSYALHREKNGRLTCQTCAGRVD